MQSTRHRTASLLLLAGLALGVQLAAPAHMHDVLAGPELDAECSLCTQLEHARPLLSSSSASPFLASVDPETRPAARPATLPRAEHQLGAPPRGPPPSPVLD